MHLLLPVCTLILAFYVVIGNAYNLELYIGEIGDGKPKTAKQYLFDYGYFPDMCSAQTCEMSTKQEETMIKNFQDFANLKQTGKVDKETINQMKIPRCGKPDTKFNQFTDTRAARYRRYNPQGTSWRKVLDGKPLTWRYAKPNAESPEDGITKDLPKDDVRKILKKAMSLWTRHTNIVFVEDTFNEPDIWIYFQGGKHGDPFPFDGPGITLAHAFYPLTNTGLAGDMHFDDAETFTQGTTQGRNLLWIATHELGHSIGLAHSNVKDAVMFPWYTGYQGNFKLRKDDILGIQSVYGEKKLIPTHSPKTEPPVPRPTTSSKQDYCPNAITAVWRMPAEDSYYISTPKTNYIYTPNSNLKPAGQFTDAFDVIDSAFTTKLKGDDVKDSMILFSGEQYFVSTDSFEKVSGPYSIHETRTNRGPLKLSFPIGVKKIHAAMRWQRNEKLYLFYRLSDGVGYYSRYVFDATGLDRDIYGKTYWNTGVKWRLPEGGPDAAIRTKDRMTYFIIGDQMYKYSDSGVKVYEGYPKPVGSDDFFDCVGTEEP